MKVSKDTSFGGIISKFPNSYINEIINTKSNVYFKFCEDNNDLGVSFLKNFSKFIKQSERNITLDFSQLPVITSKLFKQLLELHKLIMHDKRSFEIVLNREQHSSVVYVSRVGNILNIKLI